MRFDKDDKILVLHRRDLKKFYRDIPISALDNDCIPLSLNPMYASAVTVVYADNSLKFLKAKYGALGSTEFTMLNKVMNMIHEDSMDPLPIDDNFPSIFEPQKIAATVEDKRPDPRFDVICERSLTCDRHQKDVEMGHGCGGAVPHYHAGCDPCPVYPGTKCVPVCLICREKPSVKNGECEECASDH